MIYLAVDESLGFYFKAVIGVSVIISKTEIKQ
jgi:hypothetical protein